MMQMPFRLPFGLEPGRGARWLGTALIGVVLSARALPSQTPAGSDDPVRGLTRQQLTHMADSVHAVILAGKLSGGDRERASATEAALRDRLATGDFVVGDRLVIAVVGQPQLTDTFTVRQGRELLFANLPALSLAGVLRSEAQTRLSEFVGKYVKDPVVTVTPLLRVSVEGAVVRPGFYSVPSDALLSDLIMRAGGPASNSDFSRTVVKRDGYLFWGTGYLPSKLYGGATVDALGLRSGDQLVVGETKKTNFGTTAQIALSIVSVASMLIALGRR